jgi:cytochrome c2
MRAKLALAVLLAAAATAACNLRSAQVPIVEGSDAQRGKAAIGRYGCGSCHTIEGVSGARGLVGPPLTGIGAREFVAGVLPNTPENLMRWIRDPHAVDEKTAMPVLGVSSQDATDIASYLYSIK